MRGLVLTGVERVEVHDDLPDPVIESPGDAIVRVTRAGLSGSDLHLWAGREPFLAGVVPGHEAVGEVVAVGDGLTTVAIADRVVVPFSTSCGRCATCRRGLSARCDLPTGWYAALRTDTRGQDAVAVLGCGAVGLCTIVALHAHGVRPVVASDPVEARRDRAAHLGARGCTPGELAAVVAAVEAVRPGGTIQVVAVPTRPTLDLSPVQAYDRNLTVRFGRAPVRSLLPEVLDAVADGRLRVPTDHVVSEPPLPLTEGPSAYRRAADPSAGTGKLTFAP